MKLFTLSTLLFFSFLFSVKNVAAQQDFIVTCKNDTIKGEVKFTLFGGTRFKGIGQSKFIIVSEDSIKEYFRSKDSLNYLAKIKPNKLNAEFIKRVEKGKIHLLEYYRNQGNNLHETTWFAYKGDEPLVEIKTNQMFGKRKEREENFYKLIGDDKELLDKFIKNNSYTFEAIRNCIKAYNSK